ncbi:MAG TPA: sugar ABC transporter substrate-binding protein [Terriglobales bacterium]|nr:sugar ABC transporter substrate-binding protein [Terriglobales bacterium]
MEKLRCLVALPTADTEYQIEQSTDAQSVAKQLNIELEIVYADNDAVAQSLQLLQAIQSSTERRPEAIIVEPVGVSAMPRVAQAACEAGIAWAVLNNQPDYIPELRKLFAAPSFSVGSDQHEIGRIQGRQFSTLLPSGGTILYIHGPSQSIAARQRIAGMHETKLPNLDVKFLAAQWTRESATRSVRNWLTLTATRQMRIALVGAQSDAMALGARLALEENYGTSRGWHDLPFTGCDGTRNAGHHWIRDGYLTATITIPPNASVAMEMCHKALRGDYAPPEYTLTVPETYPSFESLKNFHARVPRNFAWHLSHANF